MVQLIAGTVAASFSMSATNYASLVPQDTGSVAADLETIMSADGSITDVRIVLGAPGVGNSLTITLQKNNVDTAMVMVLGAADTTAVYTGAPISWVAGDLLKWKSVPTGSGVSNAYSAIAFTILTTDNNTSLQGLCGSTVWTSVTPNYGPVLASNSTVTGAPTSRTHVVPCAGTITGYRFYARGGTSIAATGWDLAIYKNGVKQDGSGGTVDTRATISSATAVATVTASFSLPVAAGDLIYYQSDRVGSAPQRSIGCSFTFVADTHGQAPFATVTSSMATGTNQFTDWADYDGTSIASGATNVLVPFGKWDFSNLYVSLTAAPSAAHSRIFTMGKNGAGASLTCTIADTATAGNDTSNAHKVRVNANDTIRMACNVGGAGTTAAVASIATVVSAVGGQGAGGGNSGNKKGGGGGIGVLYPGGAFMLQIGNPGIDIGNAT